VLFNIIMSIVVCFLFYINFVLYNYFGFFKLISYINCLLYKIHSQVIYKLFYKEGSARDQGSLYNLRNVVNRRDVTGPDDVVKKFR